MKTKKLIKALLGISFLTLGMVTVNEVKEVNAAETTASIKTFTATSGKIDSVVSYSTAKGGGTSNPAVNSGAIRLYQNSSGSAGGNVKVYVPSGYYLKEVTITSTMKTTLKHTFGSSTTYSSATDISANGSYTVTPTDTATESITIHCFGTTSSTRLYLSSITAVYDVAGGGTVNSYSVTFDSNDGSSISSQTVLEDGYASEPVAPTRDGYDFLGWYTDETWSTQWNFETMAITKDTTIYARWQVEDPNQPKWTLVTDSADLAIGGKYIITNATDTYAMGAQGGNNRGQVAISPKDNAIKDKNLDSNVAQFTLEAGTVADTYAFNDGTGYLYAASSGSNYLRTQTTNDANGSWTISIASSGVATIKAQGSNTRNWLRYNSNSSIFSCYSSGQADVSLYKYYDPSAAYTVSFVNYEGGTEVAAQSVADGGKVNQPAALIRDGYTFGGWYTDATYSTEWDFANDTVSGDITLYAKWNNDACAYVDLVESYMELAYRYTVANEDLPTYKKITSAEEIVNGSSVIIVSVDAEGNRYALSNRNKAGSGKLDPVAVVANEDVIEDYSSRITWSVAGDSTNGFTLANGEEFLKTYSGNTNLNVSTEGTTFTVGSDENGNFYLVGERENSVPMYVTAADGNYFKDYNVGNVGKEMSGSTYASSLEIYVSDEENTVAKDVYSGAEFRIKFGIAKEDMNAVMEDVPAGAVFGLEVSTADKTEQFTTFRDDDETCHYVVVSLGDVINEIENATVEFTVKAFIQLDGITYYTEDATLVKTYSVASMVETYYTNGDTRVESLYNYFESKGLYA